jgi:hypothetical protein
MKPLTNLVGQAPGNVVARILDGRVVDSAYFSDGEAEPAPPSAVAQIAEMSWTGEPPRSVELPGLGWYRMVGRPGDGNEIPVTGVSRTPAWEAMVRETAIVSGLTALAVVITALSTVAIVRFALRPLRRVAQFGEPHRCAPDGFCRSTLYLGAAGHRGADDHCGQLRAAAAAPGRDHRRLGGRHAADRR